MTLTRIPLAPKRFKIILNFNYLTEAKTIKLILKRTLYSSQMVYTLLFGNNFISESPRCVKIQKKVLFDLNEDDNGPYLSTQIFDSSGENIIVKVERNVCTYYNSQELVRKHNERNYLLIDNKNGENTLQSRVLDKKTILVSGIFSFKEFVLVSTQNYIVLPSGKKMMHNRVSARNGPVLIINEGIIQEDNRDLKQR